MKIKKILYAVIFCKALSFLACADELPEVSPDAIDNASDWWQRVDPYRKSDEKLNWRGRFKDVEVEASLPKEAKKFKDIILRIQIVNRDVSDFVLKFPHGGLPGVQFKLYDETGALLTRTPFGKIYLPDRLGDIFSIQGITLGKGMACTSYLRITEFFDLEKCGTYWLTVTWAQWNLGDTSDVNSPFYTPDITVKSKFSIEKYKEGLRLFDRP